MAMKGRSIRSITLVIVLTLLVIILCGWQETLVPASGATPTTGQPQVTTVPWPPIRIYLDFSELPAAGKTVLLTFTINVNELWYGEWQGRKVEDLNHTRAWLQVFWADIHGSYSAARKFAEVPVSQVSLDSDFSWEGNALDTKDIKLRGNIQIPKEGIWKIVGYFAADTWDQPLEINDPIYHGVEDKTPVFTYKQYAVADAIAADMSRSDFSVGPLAYLGDINYGRMPDHQLDETVNPVIMQLDISKPPLVGEEVVLTCRILSLHDVPGFFAQIIFRKGPRFTTDIPVSDFLVNGELKWHGDLKSQIPVTISATIKFPESGEWQIFIGGNSVEREDADLSGYSDAIKLTVNKDKAYYGWGGPSPDATPRGCGSSA